MSLAAKILRKNWLPRVFKKYFLQDNWKSKQSIENSNRFYPSEVSTYENEPTKDKFAIIRIGDYGEGVISKTSFQAGTLIFRFSGFPLPYQTLFTLQKQQGLYIEDPYFMGKVLHSCDPNASVNMETQEFWAIKDIHPGDLITMDYETTEDELFRGFQCACGSENCRGRIAGKIRS